MKANTKYHFHLTFKCLVFITCQMLKPNTEQEQSARQLWMWTQGFAQIILCLHFRQDKYNPKLKSILDVTDTTPDNYNYQLLNQSNGVIHY